MFGWCDIPPASAPKGSSCDSDDGPAAWFGSDPRQPGEDWPFCHGQHISSVVLDYERQTGVIQRSNSTSLAIYDTLKKSVAYEKIYDFPGQVDTSWLESWHWSTEGAVEHSL